MDLRSRKMEIRSCDRRIDLARLSLLVLLFSTGLATSTALSLRLAVAHRKIRPQPSILVAIGTGSPASLYWFLQAYCLLRRWSPVRLLWWVRDLD
ncbi:hypothetical protein TIFTF001_038507 [Ficus carica]|uniref:Uncharacterized protein n=1 Tax=Ficus carica TaxID=3494 RepID=A0AA88JER0_FICCA|nr:hypothetical protein TIFTF001_038507 [Ficus carica]